MLRISVCLFLLEIYKAKEAQVFINTTKSTINHAKSIIQNLQASSSLPFSDIFPMQWVISRFETTPCRERIFTPELTILGFLSQVISADPSCQLAVSQIIAYLVSNGKKVPSANTSAYCQARSRLPIEVISSAAKEIAQELENKTPDDWLWRNRHVKIADGTTLSMPDTQANRAIYPQMRTQKPGVGFPIMRVVGIFSSATGCIIDCATSVYAGKGTGEPTLIRQLLHNFNQGDIFIADTCYCSYFLISLLINKGVDVVFPQHQARKTNFSDGKKLGEKDHLVQWAKPNRPQWMSAQTYRAFPENITMRETSVSYSRPGFRDVSRTLVTTLTCHKTVQTRDLEQLYNYRWFVEIDLCSIKEIMGMNILRSKTPTMIHKEVWTYFLAYNLIRKIMTQSAILNKVKPRQMSFKLALQTTYSFWNAGILSEIGNKNYLCLLKAIAYKKVGNRPGRDEPRKVKRRPKTYKLLIWPRNYYKNENRLVC